jgi:hypothetical protein
LSALEHKKFIYVTAVLVAFFWAIIIGVIDAFQIGWQTPSRLFPAITATIILWAIIGEYFWKKWPLSVLLRVPVLEGTWTGHLQSNWRKNKGEGQQTLPLVFVIRQNLWSLTVLSFTKERHGISCVAQILKNDPAKTIKLAYLYSLREEFKAGEGVQEGAAELRVLGKRTNELKGEYWTNMNTSGRLILTHQSSEAVESFQEARSRWKSDWQNFDEEFSE